jgi:hypothetical protein
MFLLASSVCGLFKFSDWRMAKKGYYGTGSVTFNFTPTMEGLVGEGSLAIPNFPRFFVKLCGASLIGSFLKIEFRNKDERAFHFASVVFELNGLGNQLEGQYVGYGGYSNAIVSGTMILEPDALKTRALPMLRRTVPQVLFRPLCLQPPAMIGTRRDDCKHGVRNSKRSRPSRVGEERVGGSATGLFGLLF